MGTAVEEAGLKRVGHGLTAKRHMVRCLAGQKLTPKPAICLCPMVLLGASGCGFTGG